MVTPYASRWSAVRNGLGVEHCSMYTLICILIVNGRVVKILFRKQGPL